MPRQLVLPPSSPLGLEEAITAIDDAGFRPDQEDSLLGSAGILNGLASNQSFLGDVMIETLKGASKREETAYGPQAIMLRSPHDGYFLRANIWPAAHDNVVKASGPGSFVYGVPHDHNFHFLTAGYFGPGYVSDYYEYVYEDVAGFRGEAPTIQFIERTALGPGRILHYRPHRDIHAQFPPQSLSVSLNIVEANPALGWFDQYRFNLERGEIEAALNPNATETFLRCGLAMGHAEIRDIAEEFAQTHPSDRLRLACYEGLAKASEETDAIWRSAERSGSRLIQGEAKRRRTLMGA